MNGERTHDTKERKSRHAIVHSRNDLCVTIWVRGVFCLRLYRTCMTSIEVSFVIYGNFTLHEGYYIWPCLDGVGCIFVLLLATVWVIGYERDWCNEQERGLDVNKWNDDSTSMQYLVSCTEMESPSFVMVWLLSWRYSTISNKIDRHRLHMS